MISEAIGVAGAEAVLSILVIVKVALPEGMASSKSSSCGIEITPEVTGLSDWSGSDVSYGKIGGHLIGRNRDHPLRKASGGCDGSDGSQIIIIKNKVQRDLWDLDSKIEDKLAGVVVELLVKDFSSSTGVPWSASQKKEFVESGSQEDSFKFHLGVPWSATQMEEFVATEHLNAI